MGIIDSLFGTKKTSSTTTVSSILPEDIYQAGQLELQDIIAPAAVEVQAKSIKIGDKVHEVFMLSRIHVLFLIAGLHPLLIWTKFLILQSMCILLKRLVY